MLLRSAASHWTTRYSGIRNAAEEKQAARAVSELTAALAERVRELSGVLRLVKAEQAKGLHTDEEDVCVKYYT
jgi:hypothetical protein